VGTNTDIDERRSQAAELAELNASLECHVEERTRERDRTWSVLQDLMVVIDATGTFQAVSPAARRILGWKGGEMIGRTVFDFIHPDDISLTVSALEAAEGAELARVENRYRHRDGATAGWPGPRRGKAVSIYAAGRNITAEKEHARHERALGRRRRQGQPTEPEGPHHHGLCRERSRRQWSPRPRHGRPDEAFRHGGACITDKNLIALR
jgi:PAS domain S-box-containing protein